jgi:hypothetical protein
MDCESYIKSSLRTRDRQSVKWHHPTTPQDNFKATPSAGKVMATVVWDA